MVKKESVLHGYLAELRRIAALEDDAALAALDRFLTENLSAAENVHGADAEEEKLAVLASGPGLFLVLSPEHFRIVAASSSYLEATMRTREELVGRPLFEAFPDDPAERDADGVSNLRRSLQRVLQTGEPHTMAVQRYPIPRPAARGGGFEERYWSPVNAPILDADGDVRYIVHRVEDVTEYINNRYGALPGGREIRLGSNLERMEADLILRAREIQAQNTRLAESEQRLRSIFEGAAAGISVNDDQGRFLYCNAAYCNMLGYTLEELRQTDFLSLTHPDDRPRNMRLIEQLLNGQRSSFVIEKRYLKKDGGLVWARLSVSILQTDESEPLRLVGVAEDITAEREALHRLHETEQLLLIAGRAARVGGWLYEPDTGRCYWSDVVCEIHDEPAGTVVTLDEAMSYYAPEWRPVIEGAMQRCLEDGTPYDLDLQIITARGRRVWVRIIGEAVRDAEGNVRRLQGGVQDLTRQKEAESALLESEAAMNHLAEAMPHIVWAAAADGAMEYVTTAVTAYSGLPRNELIGLRWLQLLHPDDRKPASEAWMQATAEGDPFVAEFRLRRHDGAYRWHLAQGQAQRDEAGAIRRWYGSLLDIHDVRRLEEDTRQLAHRLSTVLESITEAFFTMDHDWRITFLNAEMERLVELERSQLLGHTLFEAFPAARGSEFERQYARAMSENEAVQFEAYYGPLGKWFAVNAYPADDGLAVFFRDISHERNIQEQLRFTEARFRNVARATSDVVWDWDLVSDRLWWSDGLLDTFGLDPTQIASDSVSWSSRIHPEARERVLQGIQEAIEGTGEAWQDEYRFQRGDGAYVWVEDRGFIIRDDQGCALRMVGGIRDVTERLEATERLREQAMLLERAQDAILVRNLDHTIVYANQSAERIYGWRREEMLGRSIRDLLYEHPRPFDEATAAVLRDGEWSGELMHLCKDGSTITVEGRWSLVLDRHGQPQRILAINTDITERRRLLAQFLRAQRMESIGTLAGGIAHDLNNVLSPILLSIGMLRMKLSDPELQKTLTVIESSATLGADLVRQVLAYARGLDGLRIHVDVMRTIEEVVRIVRNTFPRNIILETRFGQQTWPILGDPSQIHQVLLNLFVNARDAMPGGGMLTVTADNQTLDESFAAMSLDVQPGRYVCVSVQDTGAGMDADTMERIFDPFFTTKEVGQGTGLGLSTVAAIMRSHGGFVHVQSQRGKGSTFYLYFPVSDTVDTSLEDASTPQTAVPRGDGQLILVVDDESAVREVTRETLESFGYRVVTASDGADAVATYARLGSEIALILTDIMMPVMDGPAAIRALQRMNGDVKIIAASGVGGGRSEARASKAGVQRFLPKPYTAETLLTAVYETLHG